MRKALYIFLVMAAFVGTSAAETNQSATLSNTTGKPLYHDRRQDISYDIDAVCSFLTEYMEPANYLQKDELKSFQAGKFSKTSIVRHSSVYYPDANNTKEADYIDKFTVYTFQSDGIEIDYSKNDENKQTLIWRVEYSAERLPIELRQKPFYISKFQIKNLKKDAETINLTCDYAEISVLFKNETLKNLNLSISYSAI